MRRDILEAYIHNALHPLRTYRRMTHYVLLAQQFDDIFVKGAYYWLYERIKPGTTLVDIGANIADSTLYFAMHPNVDRVLAFEPNPGTYGIARELVGRSPFRDKIALKNQAVSTGKGKMAVDAGYAGDRMFSLTGKGGGRSGAYEMETVTLNGIIGGRRNVAIKSDCEGSEYGIFSDAADLSDVYAIMLEYHSGVRKLGRVLAGKGFRVRTEETSRGVGFLYAWKGKKRG